MKTIFIKAFIATIILAVFSTSFVQSSASAAVTNTSVTNEVITNNTISENEEIKENNVVQTRSSLPPRQPVKDPFWKWVTITMAAFVGLNVAQTFVSNAINNGIDKACKKFKNTPGIKQGCKIVQRG